MPTARETVKIFALAMLGAVSTAASVKPVTSDRSP
jgi:hypothetical protein